MENLPNKSQSDRATFSPIKLLSNLITNFNIGGNMSEQGADKGGENISQGFKFFFVACGLGVLIALLFWRLPDLANFIITLKNS